LDKLTIKLIRWAKCCMVLESDRTRSTDRSRTKYVKNDMESFNLSQENAQHWTKWRRRFSGNWLTQEKWPLRISPPVCVHHDTCRTVEILEQLLINMVDITNMLLSINNTLFWLVV